MDLRYVRFHTQLHVAACCCVLLGVVAQSLKPVKRLGTRKRTQQLPTLLAYSTSKLVLRILSFQHWETGKRQGGVGWGRGESPVIIPNLLIACGAKKGRGTKARKGKGRGGAYYKSRCFCILSTNILTNPDQGNVSCQYVTNHKKGELLNLHHGCFFLIHENKLLIAAQPITLVSASQTEFTALEAL